MKIQITQRGVRDENDERYPLGAIIDVAEPLPKKFVNRCLILEADGRVMVGNPAPALTGAVSQTHLDRREAFEAALIKLVEGDFIAPDGVPKVGAINRDLPPGTTAFTAKERDELWAEIGAEQPKEE